MLLNNNTGNKGKMHQNHLILGGAPKSGTTSLFRYLADHPQICPSIRKETYFFAREFDYKGVCDLDETRQGFESCFSHCGEPYRWRLEGTPYTLYSRDASRKIHSILPDAIVLFILRDPVARLFSDYNFHMLRRHPYVHGPFESYVKFHLNRSRHHPNPIDLGCYINYLKNFKTFFMRQKVHIIFFEDLIKNQKGEMKKLCSLLKINPGFYDKYRFIPQNPTINARNKKIHRLKMWFEPLIVRLRVRSLNNPKVNQQFEKIMLSTKKIYYRLNHRKAAGKKEVITPEARSLLAEYYRPYNKALSKEIGQPLPWG